MIEPGRVSAKLPPPKDFRLLRAEISSAWYADPPAAQSARTYTKPQKNGLRYERRVQKHLEEQYGKLYVASPWICFREALDETVVHRCQPDGLLFSDNGSRVTIVEIKNSHTQRAWWQLRKLYQPVLQALLREVSVQVCEVTRYYDNMIPFNEKVELVREIGQDTRNFKVHILKP